MSQQVHTLLEKTMIAGLSYTVLYQTGLCGYRRMYGRGVVMMAGEVIKKNCTIADANTAELLRRQIFEFNEMEVVARRRE